MWDVGLAKMLKERDNKNSIGPCTGKVVGINPLKISILDGQIILQQYQLIRCAHVVSLIINDEVLVIPAENEQVFFIVGKVGV